MGSARTTIAVLVALILLGVGLWISRSSKATAASAQSVAADPATAPPELTQVQIINPSLPAIVSPAPPAPKGAVATLLETKRVAFTFAGAAGDDVVQYLDAVFRKSQGKSIVIDPSALARMQDSTVTLTMQDVSMETALKTVCKLAGNVSYVIDEKAGVVTIQAAK